MSRTRLASWCVGLVFAGGSCAQGNELLNAGFESGSLSPWYGVGDGVLGLSGDARSGAWAGEMTGRTEFWNAPSQNIVLESGRAYEFAAWVKLRSASSDPVVITIQIDDAAGTRYLRVAERVISAGEWVRVSGLGSYELFEPVSNVRFYVEGPPAGVSYLIDDASVTPLDGSDWRVDSAAGIELYRKRDVRVRVVDQDGLARHDATVSMRQTGHAFRFGSAIAASALEIPEYTAFLRDHFNMATPENAWKWPALAPSPSVREYGGADAIRDFCVAHGIRIHGHNVVWAVEQFVPWWVQPLAGDALRDTVDAHVVDLVTRYRGETDAWDVNNEMLHGSFYEDRLGAGFRAELFGGVRAADGDVPLYLNDYSILTGGELERYLEQAQALIDAGADVGGLGVQGHYSGPVNPHLLRAQLDRLGSLGVPVRITEYDNAWLGASDEARADSLETLYRVAFSHPDVEAISLWGFWADRHWRGSDAALIESDWTVNAVGQRLGMLLDEWQSEVSAGVDGHGVVESRVFHGAYEVTAAEIGGDGLETVVLEVVPGDGVVELEVVLPAKPCGPVDLASPRGQLDGADLIEFLGVFGDLEVTDLDGDGLTTFFDVLIAVGEVEMGCGPS